MRHLIQNCGIPTLSEAGIAPYEAEALIVAQLAGLKPSTKPYILHMLGIPGSGKTTFIRTLDATNAVVLSFDALMESLPVYLADKVSLGAERAFARWEQAAREMGYEILFRCLEQRYNLIFDHSGARADHVELLAYAKRQLGYTIRIMALLTDVETARERAAPRERYVPASYFYERNAIIRKLLPKYKQIADSYEEKDTSIPAIPIYDALSN